MGTERGRELAIIDSFIGLADRLVEDFDILDVTIQLTEDCARVLDVKAAGLLLADGAGVLHLLAATSESAQTLELFQLQREEGPCLDCFRTGQAVNVADLGAESARWPRFAATATNEGFASVHAVPMRLRNEMLGALGLFGATPGALSDDDLSLARALAHVASLAIGQHGHIVGRGSLLPSLQAAVSSRGLLEMARGVVAEALTVDMDVALRRIRSHAHRREVRLAEVARMLVSNDQPARRALLDELSTPET
jgi:hypothetical protein